MRQTDVKSSSALSYIVTREWQHSTLVRGFLLFALVAGAFAADFNHFAFRKRFPAGIRATATDSAGNLYVAGDIGSLGTIPVVNAMQPRHGDGNCTGDHKFNVLCPDLYVTKFDPTGTQIIYSTYIGRAQQEVRPSLVVTPEGDVYLAGTAYPASYGFSDPGGTAFVVKLDRSGSRLHYLTSLGANTKATSLAVDAQGNAVVAGISYSIGFPQKGGLSYPASPAGAFVTRDNGATWAPVQGHLPPQGVYSVIADPARPSALYAATELGLWQTRDRGANWVSVMPEPEIIRSVAADARKGAVYALGTSGRLWQSRGDGLPWQVLKLPSSPNNEVRAFAVDPARAGAVWVLQGSGTLVRSDDGGVTWIDVNTFGYGALSPKEEAGFRFPRPEPGN